MVTGEAWGAFCEYLWENWLHLNGMQLYIEICVTAFSFIV